MTLREEFRAARDEDRAAKRVAQRMRKEMEAGGALHGWTRALSGIGFVSLYTAPQSRSACIVISTTGSAMVANVLDGPIEAAVAFCTATDVDVVEDGA